MLTDHLGQLQAIQFRHAHIHQHHGHIGSQKDVQGLPAGRSLDQVLAQSAQNRLIAEQLAGLIVDHQDVDFVSAGHKVMILVPYPAPRSWIRQRFAGRIAPQTPSLSM